MSDRLIKMDYERGKAIVMRTIIGENGIPIEKMIEMDIPQPAMSEGIIRKIKRGDDGTMYEVEEKIQFPIVSNQDKKEEE